MRLELWVTAFVACVLAAQGTIPFEYVTDHIQNINMALIDYDKAIADWTGSILGAVALMKQTSALVKIIQENKTPPQNFKLSTNDNATLSTTFVAGQNLATNTAHCVDTAIAARAKVEQIPSLGSPIAAMLFRRIIAATDAFGKAVVDHAPPTNSNNAQNVINNIQYQLQRGLAVYQ